MPFARRLLASFAGLALALSLALSPVSAHSAQQNFFPICRVLFSIGDSLPDIPGVHSAWATVLANFGCQNGTNGPA